MQSKKFPLNRADSRSRRRAGDVVVMGPVGLHEVKGGVGVWIRVGMEMEVLTKKVGIHGWMLVWKNANGFREFLTLMA